MSWQIGRIAVLGAGPGGLAASALLARSGYDVSLYNRSIERLKPVIDRGGVAIEGEGGSDEHVPLDVITTEMARAVADVDLVLCCVPANGQEELVTKLSPLIAGRVIVVFAPGSAGSLIAAQILRQYEHDIDGDVLVGETLTLPQSARITGDARVRIRLPSTNRLAAFPANRTLELCEALDGVLNVSPATNVLDTGLNNVNFIIHPGPMLLNYAAVERADGFLSLMNEGMTDGVLRCMDAVDEEKMQVCEALGLVPIDIDSVYRELGSGPEVYRNRGEPFNLKDRIWPRYIDEDTPYGTVMISSIGEHIGVPTPVCDAINTLLSMLEAKDFYTEGRTVKALGWEGMTKDQIVQYLNTGNADMS